MASDWKGNQKGLNVHYISERYKRKEATFTLFEMILKVVIPHVGCATAEAATSATSIIGCCPNFL